MAASRPLLSRDDGSSMSRPVVFKLLIALLVLIVLSLFLAGGLLVLRQVRRKRKAYELPKYNEKRGSGSLHQPRLTIATFRERPESICIYQEKQKLIEDSASPPQSPIPEIRITFPEEVDESGRKLSGRVVIVRVGDQSIGLEPLHDELPPYQKDPTDRFQSLDLERIGGLKEKN